MTQKFGGEFSPEGKHQTTGEGRADIGTPGSKLQVGGLSNRFRGRKIHQPNFRSKLLFFAPLPLLFSAMGAMRHGSALTLVIDLAALGLLLLSPWLLTQGLKAEAAYNDRKIARPPALPRKLLAAILSGVGVALACLVTLGSASLITPLLYGAIATGAHILSFGLDPMRRKGMEGHSEFDSNRVAKAVEKAEKLLAETLSAARRFNDRQLEGRVESLAQAARDMFRTVEDDPRDLTSARKFLTVYLMGARDATQKFADIYSKNRDTVARDEYQALLDDLENSFQGQRQRLLLDDRSALDVEIEVLRDRLKQEGLKAQ